MKERLTLSVTFLFFFICVCGDCAPAGHVGQHLLEFSYRECPGAVQSRIGPAEKRG